MAGFAETVDLFENTVKPNIAAIINPFDNFLSIVILLSKSVFHIIKNRLQIKQSASIFGILSFIFIITVLKIYLLS